MRTVICGFPGCGKSTVFRALSPGASTSRGGVVYGNIKVPDTRVVGLSAFFKPKKETYAEITFTDVAGAGGKVGKAFPPGVVQAMRNADVMVHVVRGFESPMLAEPADPRRDVVAFEEELLLLDLGVLEKRADRFKKERKKGTEVEVNAKAVAWLEEGHPLRDLELNAIEQQTFQGIQLLSMTPLLTVYNLAEADFADSDLRQKGGSTFALCGELEAEIAEMAPEDQREFLDELGLGEPARNEFIQAAYETLDLISFLTAGADECRAWPIRRGSNARTAAGKIHSDIERGFIRAEVYVLEDLLAVGSEGGLKAAGKLRVEGKDYVVQDGDVINFRFNV